jgi:hypothetical protein
VLTITGLSLTTFLKWEELSLSRRVELLPVFVVSNRLGLSVGFLDYAPRAGFGPPYVGVGEGTRYDWPEVVAWSTGRGLSLTEPEVHAEGRSGDISASPTGRRNGSEAQQKRA